MTNTNVREDLAAELEKELIQQGERRCLNNPYAHAFGYLCSMLRGGTYNDEGIKQHLIAIKSR